MAEAQAGSRGRAARAAASRLVLGVIGARIPLSEQIAAPEGALAPLAPATRAHAQRLALATLRHLSGADRTLAPFLKRPPEGLARAALRVAVVEHFAEGAPAHAVVNDTVANLRADRRAARFAGLANAVLRRALATPAETWAALPPERLPGWLRKPLVAAWGAAAVTAIETAHADGAPLDLTPRAPGSAAALAAQLQARILPTGSLRLDGRAQVSALAGYAEGAFWVQDAAAALPAQLLAPEPGARVLDLCAAPGGKTLQLAAAGAQVTALDISATRMARLSENLARTGLSADLVTADALDWQPNAPFDAILLDAPCTATGTIRRHPDLPHVRDARALDSLVPLQAALIDRATGFLRPGGRLVFATCSLLPAEGEHQTTAALHRNPDLRVVPAALPGADPAWSSPDGGLRLRPDHWAGLGGLDGFYMVCFQRSAHPGAPPAPGSAS